jgi:O-antigen/teichoic acid export membrane protein
MGIFFNLSIWYKLTNKTLIGAFLVATGAVITLIINILFIPRFGYVASAWGHLVCYSVMVILSYLLSRKHYTIPYDVKRVLLYFALVIGLYFIGEIVDNTGNLMKNILKPVLFLTALMVFFVSERKTFLKYRNT